MNDTFLKDNNSSDMINYTDDTNLLIFSTNYTDLSTEIIQNANNWLKN